MTDHDKGDPDGAVPEPAWVSPSETSPRVVQLATWVEANHGRFTDEALERSAIVGGYTAEEYTAAIALADRREHERRAITPIKALARVVIVAAYAVVWLVFAYAYIVAAPANGTGLSSGFGRLLQGILTGSLAVGLVISAVAVHKAHPDPDRAVRALVIVLAVPVITLVAITGLCVPFLGAA